MLRHIYLQIDALEPLVFSERSATAGAHLALDYIPGRMLLGVAARRYDQFGADAASIFHLGAVCFGDGLPLDGDGRVAVPTPLALQSLKGQEDEVYNLAIKAPKSQTEKLKAPYVSLLGQSKLQPLRVAKSRFTKTAIEPDGQNRAQESALFGYETISAGQRFLCKLTLNQDVSQATERKLLDALVGRHFLGRSRSAQFGRVEVKVVDAAVGQLEVAAAGLRNAVSVLLLSDLYLLNAVGAPAAAPTAEDFGLPASWSLDLERSFARQRIDDRFNSYRRAHDNQRQLFVRGSVFTFKCEKGEARHIQSGFVWAGEDRCEGLGAALIAPAMLEIERPALQKRDDAVVHEQAAKPEGAWLEWLEQRRGGLSRRERELVQQEAQLLVRTVILREQQPSLSQWSNLASWAFERTSKEEITTAAWQEMVGGTSGRWSRGWQYNVILPNAQSSESDGLQSKEPPKIGEFVVEFGRAHGPLALRELAKQVRSALKQRVDHQNASQQRS